MYIYMYICLYKKTLWKCVQNLKRKNAFFTCKVQLHSNQVFIILSNLIQISHVCLLDIYIAKMLKTEREKSKRFTTNSRY